MNKKTLMGRFAVLSMLILAVMLVFSGCGSRTAKATITYQSVSLDASNSWGATEIDQVGKMVQSVYDDANFDVRDMLIAATRGYDLIDGEDAPDNETLGELDPV